MKDKQALEHILKLTEFLMKKEMDGDEDIPTFDKLFPQESKLPVEGMVDEKLPKDGMMAIEVTKMSPKKDLKMKPELSPEDIMSILEDEEED